MAAVSEQSNEEVLHQPGGFTLKHPAAGLQLFNLHSFIVLLLHHIMYISAVFMHEAATP